MRSILIFFSILYSTFLGAQISPMYIGSYTSNGSQGLYIYDFNEISGEAKFLNSISLSNPSFLAKNGRFLYVVNEDVNGAVSAVNWNDKYVLNSLPTQGAHPCHISLSPSDSVLVVSNYSGGSLILYSYNADGSLKKQEDFMQFNKSSINSSRQTRSHIHSAFFSNDGKSVFVCDLGADLIYKIEIEKIGSGYKFKVIEEITTKLGGGPRHIVISPDSNKLYVVLELTGELEVIERQAGKWLSKQILPIYSAGFDGEHGAADIKMTKDGKYLYATNRGECNEVAVYKVKRNGLLDLIQIQSVEGNSPRNVQLSPNEKWLIISNQLSGTVNFFKRNSKSGKLGELEDSIAIPSAVCVIF